MLQVQVGTRLHGEGMPCRALPPRHQGRDTEIAGGERRAEEIRPNLCCVDKRRARTSRCVLDWEAAIPNRVHSHEGDKMTKTCGECQWTWKKEKTQIWCKLIFPEYGYHRDEKSPICFTRRMFEVMREEIKRQHAKLWRITACGGHEICRIAANTELPGHTEDGLVPKHYERCYGCPVRNWERSRTL